MFETSTELIILFIVFSAILILGLVIFITSIIYRYQQKQNAYFKDIEILNASHQNELLQAQLEMQEQTFQNISREIHDNIGQKLTLAKLHLNTLGYTDADKTRQQVGGSVDMISEAINDLSDISRSLSSENILNNGLIKALEFEVAQLEKSNMYDVSLSVTGNTRFLDTHRELVLFRIFQEILNNIIKHAQANSIMIDLHYNTTTLSLNIFDNGVGFSSGQLSKRGMGLSNMEKRAKFLKGECIIGSQPKIGTNVNIKIPLYENNTAV
jgi:two-component system, NarL family, sensor kinase